MTTNPPGATTGATNITVNYEYSIPLWDFASLDGAANSIRHDNEAGQIIRLTYQLNEADNPEDRRTHQLATTGEDGASGNCDVCSEYTLLGRGRVRSRRRRGHRSGIRELGKNQSDLQRLTEWSFDHRLGGGICRRPITASAMYTSRG